MAAFDLIMGAFVPRVRQVTAVEARIVAESTTSKKSSTTPLAPRRRLLLPSRAGASGEGTKGGSRG